MRRCGTQVEQHAGVPLRRVRAGEVRCEEFLYELKAGPGRPEAARRPGNDTTITGEPASPSTPGSTSQAAGEGSSRSHIGVGPGGGW